MKNVFWVVILMLVASLATAQGKFSLNGYVQNSEDGEALIGATIFIEELGTGTSANIYGFYSVTLPPGKYTVQYRYVTFNTESRTVELNANQRLDVELSPESTELDEIVITDKALNANVVDIEMSAEKLDIKTIEKIPAFLGEVDVIKSIQLLPGVSSVGEGSSGFNVRGGSVGQNLVLLDDAPVYNSSHLLGFFSVINPDAVIDE